MTSSSPRARAFGDELTNLALGALIGAMLLAGALRLAGSIAAFVTGAPQPAAGLEAGVGVVLHADDPGSALGSASLSPVAYWITVALLLTAIGTATWFIWRWVRELDDTVLRPAAFLVWSLGACLFAHCISFFSVSYFDQIVIMYYWLLAVIASLGLVLESRRWALAAQDSAAFPADPNLQGAEAAPGLAEPATLNGGN